MGALTRLNLKSDSWCRSQEKMFSEYKLKEIRCDMSVYDQIWVVSYYLAPVLKVLWPPIVSASSYIPLPNNLHLQLHYKMGSTHILELSVWDINIYQFTRSNNTTPTRVFVIIIKIWWVPAILTRSYKSTEIGHNMIFIKFMPFVSFTLRIKTIHIVNNVLYYNSLTLKIIAITTKSLLKCFPMSSQIVVSVVANHSYSQFRGKGETQRLVGCWEV